MTIPFDIVYLENRIENIKNEIVKKGFQGFFKDLGSKYPLSMIFSDKKITRISSLKLRGDSKKPIGTNDVLNFFKEDLKFITSKSNHPLSKIFEICQLIHKSNLFINHPKILGRLLRDLSDSLAAEIPVWKKVAGTYIAGHLDILFLNGNHIIIGDYKRNLQEIKDGLPQITTYAILFKNLLKKYSPEIESIPLICVCFTDKYAVHFDPEQLAPKLLRFIQIENQLRVKGGLKVLPTTKSKYHKIQKFL